jgi:ABC-type lipoprotein export system ATPase subunit
MTAPVSVGSRADPSAVVALDRLSVGNAAGVPLVMGIRLTVRAGEAIAIVGRVGSGKGALLRLIAGQRPPIAGSAIVLGMDLGSLDYRGRQALALGVGFVFERTGIWPNRSVLDNVVLPLRYHFPDVDAAARGRTLAEELGIGDALRERASDVDQSVQKRMLFARALSLDPRVLLVDEPQVFLTPDEASVVAEAVERRRAGGTAVIYADHDGALGPFDVQRTCIVQDGRFRNAAGALQRPEDWPLSVREGPSST